MNPAPAKGIESFPTPVIDDVVIAEVVNSWKGDYQKLEYGTLWKDVSHAPNQGSFPEHKLVFQQPTSEDGQWIKRIWVNDRVNQDSYNYAIKYSAGSQQHPIYIRNYVVPREGYAPLPDGTTDPLFPTAVLVDEEANRIEGELDSKYVRVTRVYETLPGPEVPTKRYNERGDLETVIVQTVPPFTPPDPDGLLVTGSQVVQEEMGKGVKTTSTVQDHALLQIKENKEGLLGETITTDDIVDPSTNPDTLSQTVVSSVVEQFSATKARKRTTTASGPTSLSQKNNDGKLLGDITSTQSIVAPATSPDAVSSSILSSEVKQIDSGKAVKTNIVLNSTPTLSGNQNEEGLLGNKSVVETIVAAGTSADSLSTTVLSSSVEAIDSVRSKKTTITSTGPTSLTQKSNDGKLIGDITVTESVVPPTDNPDAITTSIFSSEVKQVDSGKAIKKNTVINSTPTLTSKRKSGGLMGNTRTVETVVSAGTEADAINTVIVESIVEPINSSISRKATTSQEGPTSLVGGAFKEGLLGETVITESIVTASSNPDALSQTVVSSTIEPIDSAKSKKTTITSTGPTSLTQKSKDGKLLGDVISTQSIVAAGTSPDAVSSSILSSDVKQIDSGKAVKTNVVINSTPTLSGNQNTQGLLGNTQVVESIVPAGTAADALSQSVVSSVVEAIDSVRSKKTTTNSDGPTSLITTSLVDSAVGQVSATVSKSIVPIGDTPTGGKSVLQDQITAIDSVKAQRDTVTVSTYPELTSYDLDEALGVSIITEREVVDHNTPYCVPPLVLTLNDRPLDQWKTLRITSRLSGLPPQRIEYTTKQFTFPAILLNQSSPSSLPVNVTQQNVGFGRVATSVEGVTQWVASGANKFISITPNQLRPAVSLPTRFKTLLTFIDASTNPSGIIPISPNDDVYKISPQSVSYSGSLFSFNFGEVLTNGFTISVTASQYDERYKGLNETITISPSSPTASQYWLTDRSSEKLISWDVEYWRSNIWILRKTYITLI